jgi:hypothetical protein
VRSSPALPPHWAAGNETVIPSKRSYGSMKTLWLNNGLSITLFTLFVVFFSGQAVTGWLQENQELEQHQQGGVTFAHYVASDSFIEVTAENWESEFLQMFIYVLFTVFLFQLVGVQMSGRTRGSRPRPPTLKRQAVRAVAGACRGRGVEAL